MPVPVLSAIAAGDFTTAALLTGYLDRASSRRASECRAALESSTSLEDLVDSLAEGTRLTETEVLDLVGSWAAAHSVPANT